MHKEVKEFYTAPGVPENLLKDVGEEKCSELIDKIKERFKTNFETYKEDCPDQSKLSGLDDWIEDTKMKDMIVICLQLMLNMPSDIEDREFYKIMRVRKLQRKCKKASFVIDDNLFDQVVNSTKQSIMKDLKIAPKVKMQVLK